MRPSKKVAILRRHLAELAKPRCKLAVPTAFVAIPTADVFLSALTVGEIARGVSLLVPGPKKTHLTGWLDGLENLYRGTNTPYRHRDGPHLGKVDGERPEDRNRHPPTDGPLAASAIRQGLHVMTRNTKHFQASGALIIAPWSTA